MLLHVHAVAGEVEDIAALLKRVMTESGMSQSEIAERSGVPLATLNAWITRRRSPGRGTVVSDRLRRLADVLPGASRREVFEAAGRTVPGPLTSDAQRRVVELFVGLSSGRQKLALQMLETLAAEESRPVRP